MKINWFLIVISLFIAALSGYGFYAGSSNLFLTFGSGITLFVTISGILAVSFDKGSANIKVVSVFFMLVMLAEHLAFAFIGFKIAPYIIITGIIILLYVVIFYGIAKALKE
ncbi:MAG: hypothetical protein ACI4LX_09730 [Treponema sp.]